MCDIIVYFQRSAPSALFEEIAKSYGVSKTRLAVWASLFFFPYAAIQPFAGLLSDLIEPAFLVGGATLFASFGAAMCGFSKTFGVGCAGRFIVGLGSGPVYCACIRIIANWFPLKWYVVATGLFQTIAVIGALLGQGPVAALSKAIGWRWCFYMVAIIGAVSGVFSILFTRGHPVEYGYAPVDAPPQVHGKRVVDLLITLGKNCLSVLKNPRFWLTIGMTVALNGPYYGLNSYWGGPLLGDVYGYDAAKRGNALMGISVGCMVGSFVDPMVSQILHTRKWVVIVGLMLGALSLTPFLFWESTLSFWGVVTSFFFYSMLSVGLCPVLYTMVREFYPPHLSASAIGMLNLFSFFSGSIYQLIEGAVIDSVNKGRPKSEVFVGYRYGVIVLSMVSMMIGCVILGFVKDTHPTQWKEDPYALSVQSVD
jgi:sugar phosphate permease